MPRRCARNAVLMVNFRYSWWCICVFVCVFADVRRVVSRKWVARKCHTREKFKWWTHLGVTTHNDVAHFNFNCLALSLSLTLFLSCTPRHLQFSIVFRLLSLNWPSFWPCASGHHLLALVDKWIKWRSIFGIVLVLFSMVFPYGWRPGLRFGMRTLCALRLCVKISDSGLCTHFSKSL